MPLSRSCGLFAGAVLRGPESESILRHALRPTASSKPVENLGMLRTSHFCSIYEPKLQEQQRHHGLAFRRDGKAHHGVSESRPFKFLKDIL